MTYDPRKTVAVPVTIQEAIDDVARIEQLVKDAYRLLDMAEQVGERHKIRVKAQVHNRHHLHHDSALKPIRVQAWQRLMGVTGLRQIMDTKALDEFESQLYKDAPEFSEESVSGTLLSKLQDSETMFARGLVEMFRILSGAYKTNKDAAFKIPRKIILRNVVSCVPQGLVINYHHNSRIDDIDRVFKTLDGKKFESYDLIAELNKSWQEDGLHECDTYKARAYINGNMHLEFKRDDLLEKANDIIAQWYGATLGANRK